MSLHEFACPKCQKLFEENVSIMNDVRKLPCPTCGTQSEKIIGAPQFSVKGANAANQYSGASNFSGNGSEIGNKNK